MSNNQHHKCMYHRDKVVHHLDPMIHAQVLRQYVTRYQNPMLISGKWTPSGYKSSGTLVLMLTDIMPHDLSY